MPDFPAVHKVGSLRKFLKDIQTAGEPAKVTIDFLESLGFKSKNDRSIVTVLRFLSLTDQEGKPTENYSQYRNRQLSGTVMADCVRKAYSELFATFPDAHNRDSEALRNFFSTKMKGGEGVLVDTVNTFKALCEFAPFDSAAHETTSTPDPQKAPLTKVPIPIAVPNPVINVSIQIHLPATEDATIYDKIFQSLKKNLFER